MPGLRIRPAQLPYEAFTSIAWARESEPTKDVRELLIIKALPMIVPDTVLQHDAEKRRIKKGLLADSDELAIFEKTLFLPYLDFTYQYPTQRGLLSKQTVIEKGRSAVLALREVDFGFAPELTALAHQLVECESDEASVVQGVDSTVLVHERLEDLTKVLADYDSELQKLSEQYDSLFKTEGAKEELKDNIDSLKKTRNERTRMFVDGLKLPSKIDLGELELLEGNLFYIPYFITRLSGRGESRFLVWDRHGKESELIADELARNRRFRELVLSHAS